MLILSDRTSLVGPKGLVTLTLVEHVHVVLADSDLASVLLQAGEQVLVEAHAGVLLLLLLLGRHLLLLGVVHGGSLLLLSGLGVTTFAAATAHHGTDTLTGDLGASTECGTLGHGAHEATAATEHTGTLLRSGLVGLGCGSLGRASRSSGSSCRAATREEAATAASAA